MEDLSILEAVERYITGQMSPDERVYFESLRKSNPEIDQAVVEHTFFLQQMNRFEETRSFKSLLNDTHINLAEKGLIRSPRLKGRAKVVYLFNRYKRTVAVAATIAGITAMTMSALVWSLSPAKPANKQDLVKLERELSNKIARVDNKTEVLKGAVDNVTTKVDQNRAANPITYTKGGTGFLVDVKGLIATSDHVLEGAKHIAVQTNDGPEMDAVVVYRDPAHDLALLRIVDKQFKAPAVLPYSIRRSTPDLAEPIFTLGFPRNDVVYGDGYIAAHTGYKGDTLSLQIDIAANHGNSGSPIVSRSGDVVGIISNKDETAEGAVFAIRSKYILQALASMKVEPSKSTGTLRGKDRVQQVKTMTDFIFLVKRD